MPVSGASDGSGGAPGPSSSVTGSQQGGNSSSTSEPGGGGGSGGAGGRSARSGLSPKGKHTASSGQFEGSMGADSGYLTSPTSTGNMSQKERSNSGKVAHLETVSEQSADQRPRKSTVLERFEQQKIKGAIKSDGQVKILVDNSGVEKSSKPIAVIATAISDDYERPPHLSSSPRIQEGLVKRLDQAKGKDKGMLGELKLAAKIHKRKPSPESPTPMRAMTKEEAEKLEMKQKTIIARTKSECAENVDDSDNSIFKRQYSMKTRKKRSDSSTQIADASPRRGEASPRRGDPSSRKGDASPRRADANSRRKSDSSTEGSAPVKRKSVDESGVRRSSSGKLLPPGQKQSESGSDADEVSSGRKDVTLMVMKNVRRRKRTTSSESQSGDERPPHIQPPLEANVVVQTRDDSKPVTKVSEFDCVCLILFR